MCIDFPEVSEIISNKDSAKEDIFNTLDIHKECTKRHIKFIEDKFRDDMAVLQAQITYQTLRIKQLEKQLQEMEQLI